MATPERDSITGTPTTGHEWDGIKELNTPLPRWWLWTFYATIVWAIAYSIAYPAWPLINTATAGLLGYSSRADVARDIADARLAQGKWLERISTSDLDQIAADPELFAFARAGGAASFRLYCVQCHGSGAAGARGYPNLNDDDWLWGGTLEQIHKTLENGIRFTGDPDTRDSQMPAFADGILTPAQISDVAEYVLKLGGQTNDAVAAARGEPLFAENCASCHGETGEGNRDLGAPRLSDPIWLLNGSKDAIVAQISNPRMGVMPAWKGRLDENTIKQLAIYVHSLGGGEQPDAQ
ncbi:MAG: cytochrome-c oxidase, cbb3-type subunit III [Rhizobiales bacterium]|nr:cytochrome-c oxidase, cbb3-type subunit III [Hyphomicrobiales bacterium]